MLDYQAGRMSGVDDNIAKLTGKRPMAVCEFTRARRPAQRRRQLRGTA
jgi:hypothetical protein